MTLGSFGSDLFRPFLRSSNERIIKILEKNIYKTKTAQLVGLNGQKAVHTGATGSPPSESYTTVAALSLPMATRSGPLAVCILNVPFSVSRCVTLYGPAYKGEREFLPFVQSLT